MNLKLQVGRLLEATTQKLIRLNYKSVPFIPNGVILPLDLKRAGLYPKVIFDVGANIGQTSNYFIKHFPKADIYSFEPVVDTFNHLKQNTANNKNIHCFNIGLGESIGTANIYLSESDSGSSTLKTHVLNDPRFKTSEEVQINTGYNFCAENNITEIDVLKIDAEGFESEVLKGFEHLLKTNVKMIYAEIGFDKTDKYKTYIADMLEVVTGSGFIISGFYEPYRWGKGKLNVFYNVLLVNTNLIEL